MAIINKT